MTVFDPKYLKPLEMGPKADPVASAYASWEEALEEWNDEHEVFQEEMKSVKKASKSLISHLETLLF